MGLSIRALPLQSLYSTARGALVSAQTSRSSSIMAQLIIRPTEAVVSAKCFILAQRFHKMAVAENQKGETAKALVDLARSASLAATGLFLAYGALNGVGLKEVFLTPKAVGERQQELLNDCVNRGCSYQYSSDFMTIALNCPTQEDYVCFTGHQPLT